MNRDCEVSYDKTVNGTVTPDVQKEVPKKHESSKRYRDGTTKSHNTLKHETAKKHKQIIVLNSIINAHGFDTSIYILCCAQGRVQGLCLGGGGGEFFF